MKPCIVCTYRPAVRGGSRCEVHELTKWRGIKGSASSRGYGAAWCKLRVQILRRDPICSWDGCVRPSTDVDHILNRARGGTDEPSNLQGLCHTHHQAKTAAEGHAAHGGGGGGSRRRIPT